jgi:hypothetical protein
MKKLKDTQEDGIKGEKFDKKCNIDIVESGQGSHTDEVNNSCAFPWGNFFFHHLWPLFEQL